MEAHTFDEILGLEERFYDEGYQQGLSDGIKAGRVEGRTFGLEKGFEKYVESAKLHGKSLVWANRIKQSLPVENSIQKELDSPTRSTLPATEMRADERNDTSSTSLPRLPSNQRLAKHIKVLHALAESESLSTENSEDAVSDFDDRLKRAQGKAKVIERMVGSGKIESAGHDDDH